MEIKEILSSNDPVQLRLLFGFTVDDDNERILFKFNIWAKFFFPKYFESEDAAFHADIDLYNLQVYKGSIISFVNIAFRGAAKTARTKLFRAFVICNDKNHYRRYLKVLSEDGTNSTQIVTDIYNMLVSPRVRALYPEVFEKTTAKREETMHSFTTATGVKVIADTVGTNQRGAIQEEARPDEIWYEDFESRNTLASARKTKKIWDNMEEARTGLAKGGSCVYTCNYISEQGNVHKLVQKAGPGRIVLIVPIMVDGVPTWNRYSKAEIEQMRQDDDDFEGERMCKPSASKDVMFDREVLDAMPVRESIRTVGGFRIYKEYDPSHRHGSGHDVAGGVGLDSSTSVFYDFDCFPAQVVGVFDNNTIKPDTFGDEIHREGEYFGNPIAAIEKNNHGHATIARAKQLGVNQFITPAKDTKVMAASQSSVSKEYGWETNGVTKPKALFSFCKAVDDGLVLLNDQRLIAECKSFTRNDLIDPETDPRLTTRHFDLLMAAAIGWQMKDYAQVAKPKFDMQAIRDLGLEEEKPLYPSIGL